MTHTLQYDVYNTVRRIQYSMTHTLQYDAYNTV
jgi:hypothetical protein